MKISSEEIGGLVNYLGEAAVDGARLICYLPGEAYLLKQEVKVFKTEYDALEFNYKNSTDKDCYATASLAPVLQAAQNIQEALDDAGLSTKIISFGFDVEQIEKQYLLNKQIEIMEVNEKNVASLENQVLKTGFGEIRRDDLINAIKEGQQHIELPFEKNYGNDQANAVLHFDKSDKGNYFFNAYDLSVKSEGQDEVFKQTFRVKYGNTYTLKEAFNLMQGRSVNKDFIKVDPDNKDNNQKYNAWATMDFKNADTNGNYSITKSYKLNVAEELSAYPIKELLNDQYRADLIDSIHRGNRQSVTFSRDGKEEKMYVEANPTHNTLKFYDANRNKISLSLKSQDNGKSADMSVGPKQEHNDDTKKASNTKAFGKKEPQGETKAKQEPTPRKSRRVA